MCRAEQGGRRPCSGHPGRAQTADVQIEISFAFGRAGSFSFSHHRTNLRAPADYTLV